VKSKNKLRHIVSVDFEISLQFIHLMLSICEVSKRQLTESKMKINILEIASDLFASGIDLIDNGQHVHLLYNLLVDYPIIITDCIQEHVIGNRYLMRNMRFIRLIADWLKHKTSVQKWKHIVTKYIPMWSEHHELGDHHVGDRTESVPVDLDLKLEMVTDIALPRDIRRIAAFLLIRTWSQFNMMERNLILNATSLLLNIESVDFADIILRNVLEHETLFVSQDIQEIMNYLLSDIGKDFIALLNALKTAPSYHKSWIEQRMTTFKKMWGSTLRQISEDIDKETLDRVTGFVFLEEHKRGMRSDLYLQVRLTPPLHEHEQKESEMMLEIEFDALIERVSQSGKIRDDISKKWEIVKAIARHWLSYYAKGGREMWNQDEEIAIETPLMELQKIEQQWKAR